jgi:uncharacterized protein (DUF1697 family)
MQTYIAILRGINVSGRNLIKMEALRSLIETLGYKNCTTYIQSGNIIFQAKKMDSSIIANAIAKAIKTSFSFDVPVLIKTQAEMETVFANNPFLLKDKKDINFLHITFLSTMPTEEAKKKIIGDFAEDLYTFIDASVYLYCPGGYGNTKLSNTFFENKLKCTATTRNWKTIIQLINMAQQL